MEYYIFDEVPNYNRPYLELPVEIDLVDSIMGKKPEFDSLPIEMPVEMNEDEEIGSTDIINPGVPFFSDKMKSALDEYGVTNIDYYPVVIIDSETEGILCKYWLAIVKGMPACIDLTKSQFKEITVERTVLTQFFIDHTKTAGLNLFRFNSIPGLIIINEELKDKLSKLDFHGVSFKNIKEYKRAV